MKRITAFFIGFVLVFSLFSSVALAEEQIDAEAAIEVDTEVIISEDS